MNDLTEKKDNAVNPAETAGEIGPLPETLMSVPGFVDDYTNYLLDTAPYPNRPLAFATALTMLAHLTGRQFCSRSGLRTNLYVIALAESGVGKDHGRKRNVDIAKAVGILPTMGNKFASGEGIEDAMLLNPVSFFQADEADTVFRSLQEKNPHTEKIYDALLEFYTSADSTYMMRKKAIATTPTKSNPFDKLRAGGIRDPHLTILGTAIPEYFYEGLTGRTLTNGLLSRCLVIETGKRGELSDGYAKPIPDSIIRIASDLVTTGAFEGVDPEDPDKVIPPPVYKMIDEEAEATRIIKEMRKLADRYYEESTNRIAATLWTRAGEKGSKLSMLYAISKDHRNPVITPEAVQWGWQVAELTTRRTFSQALSYFSDGGFDEKCQKALRILGEATNHVMKRGDLLRALRVPHDYLDKVIETLLEREQVSVTSGYNNHPVYHLV